MQETNHKKQNLLALSYAKQTLKKGSREYQRMKQYSEELGAFHVVVFTKKHEGFPDQIGEGNLTVHATNTRTKLGALLRAYALGRHITSQTSTQPWVVTCQDPFETSIVGVLLSFRRQLRLHVQIHGDNFGNPYWRASRRLNWLRLMFGRFVLARASGVRVVSERIKRALLKEGVPEEKITVLPIQPQLDAFLAVGAARTVRETDTCTFLYVGRFAPEKNLPMLIRTFAEAYKKETEIRLRLVGDGSEKEKIEALILSHNLGEVVEILPWTASVAEEMKRADVFVLPSDHEGYALVLLEAMAAGLPIVTTDVGCVGEVLKPEVHGFVSTPKDEAGFARSLARMAAAGAEARHEMGRRNHTAAKEVVISQESYIKQWTDSFNTV